MNKPEEEERDDVRFDGASPGKDDQPIMHIEDRRDEIVRKLEIAWEAALGDLFAETRAA